MDTNEINESDQGRKNELSTSDGSRSVMPKYGNEVDSDQNCQEKYDALPDDVLIRIIKYLPITQWPDLERVDRKFQQATYGAWRDLRKIRLDDDFVIIQTYDFSAKLLILILKKLLRRAPNLTSITQLDNYCVTDCINLFHQFKYLTSFSISNYDYDYSMTISALAEFLATSASRNRLKELNVSICHQETWDDQQFLIAARLLHDAFENIPDRPALELEKLSIFIGSPRYYDRIDLLFDFLNVINVSSLRKLDLRNCDTTSIDLAHLIDRSILLEELYFYFACPYDCQDDAQTNSHDALIEAIKKLENLSVLSTGYARFKSKCTRQCFDRLCSNLAELLKYFGLHRRIKELSLMDCNNIVILSIGYMWFYLTSLLLVLNHSEGESIKNLLERLVNLKKLELRGSILFHDDDASFSLTCLKRLECLRLDYFYLDNDDFGSAVKFDLDELVQLENLKELYIRNCHLDYKTLSEIWNRDAKWKLKSLALPNYKESITDEFLSWIKGMTDLLHLDLRQSEITDQDLQTIAKACPRLIDVNLDKCHLVTKKGVQYLLDGCSELKTIKISPRIDVERGFNLNKYRNVKLINY